MLLTHEVLISTLIYLQLTKLLLVPPKYEIVFARAKVVTLNLFGPFFCNGFIHRFMASFLYCFYYNCRSFTLLQFAETLLNLFSYISRLILKILS